MRVSMGVLSLTLCAVVLLSGCAPTTSSGTATPPVPTAGSGGASAGTGASSVGTASRPAAPASNPAPSGVTVNMTDQYHFEPATITIPRGTTVTWVNTGQQPHTVTADPSKAAKSGDAALPSGAQSWDSGFINAGQTFSRTFDTPGEYAYFCMPHEALGMVAKVVVNP